MDEQRIAVSDLHTTKNPLAAYAERPVGVRYQDLEQGEQVIILLRRHLITNFRWVVGVLTAALLPILWPFIPLESIGLEGLRAIPGHIQLLIVMFWYVLVFGFGLQHFLIWYFNVYLVTDRRIVDVDFIGLMHYASDEAMLHQVQDVRHMQQGLPQLLFRYGTVHVQTSGTRQNLDFERVSWPARVADIITDLMPVPTDVEWGAVTPHRQQKPDSKSRKGVSE